VTVQLRRHLRGLDPRVTRWRSPVHDCRGRVDARPPHRPAVAVACQPLVILAGVTPHVLDVPFAMRAVAAASAASWDASHGVFIYEGAALPTALAPFRALPYSWEMHVQRELTAAPAPRPTAPDAAITLRSHQQDAVRTIAAARAAELPGFLVADDVGLGKTITAWRAILDMPAARTVLVVCPLAVIAH